MLSMTRSIGYIAACLEWFVFAVTGDTRWVFSGLALLAGAAIAHFILCHRQSRELADPDTHHDTDDLYWLDAWAATAASDVDSLSWTDMAERFAELDANPMVRTQGGIARRRDRIRGMAPRHRVAWAGVVAELSPEALGPRCTCGVMRGVLTPSRACPRHGLEAT